MNIIIPKPVILPTGRLSRKKGFITIYPNGGRINISFAVVNSLSLKEKDKVVLCFDSETNFWYFVRHQNGYPIIRRNKKKGTEDTYEFVDAPFANGVRTLLKAERSNTVRFEVSFTPTNFEGNDYYPLTIIKINGSVIKS